MAFGEGDFRILNENCSANPMLALYKAMFVIIYEDRRR